MGATRRWIEQLRNFGMKSCKKMLIPSNDYGIVYHNLTTKLSQDRAAGAVSPGICLFISWKVEKKQRKSEKSIFSLAFSGMNEYTFTC